MNRLLAYLILLFLGPTFLYAQKVSLHYYLPNVTYDDNVPTPEAILGYQVGEWHVSHDQLVGYMRQLAERSDRLILNEYARSYEGRPLMTLTISAEKNIKNIEIIRQQHLALCDPTTSQKAKIDGMPVVVYQGYSVHGDEASGSNAALLMAYYLAAAQGKEVDELLNNVVIILDPCFNPDGLQRFAGWVNSHKSQHMNGDPANRELTEIWPTGRTNHYWFDLNRDWLPVQHPESQGRLKVFHQWKPNILTDHHEMGSNNTFFFQPGIPSRTNPLTPKKNQELTREIATYHAAALDAIGSTYYSEESFDDYYYGKGSTYPDVNGAIGILFEQATVAGHRKETTNGIIDFPFAVRNQVATSFSTLKAAQSMREKLLQYQRDFYQNAMKEARQDSRKAFIFGAAHDPGRLNAFVKILTTHQLEVYPLSQTIGLDTHTFKKDEAYVLPLEQSQYRLAKAIFDRSNQFNDSLFYDVSAWTLPLAFDLEYATADSKTYSEKWLGQPATEVISKGQLIGGKSNYAYLLEWDHLLAPKIANQLLQAGLIVKVATTSFDSKTTVGMKTFEPGTLLITAQNQKIGADEIYTLLQNLTPAHGIQIYSIATGLTNRGIDFGSPAFRKIKLPKVLLLAGNGLRANDVGELWHLLDQRFAIPVTVADIERFGRLDLNRYTTILLANGSYGRISKDGVGKLKKWLQQGGTLVAFNEAIRWASSQKLAYASFASRKKEQKNKALRAYEHYNNDRGSHVIGGAILETQLDLSHPLCFGYRDAQLPLFRRGTLFMEPTSNRYATPLRYTKAPLMSGYLSKGNLEALAESAAVTVSGIGRGRTIAIVDNPNFRAFWYGGNKLIANAIFFGDIIHSGTTQRSSPSKKQASGG